MRLIVNECPLDLAFKLTLFASLLNQELDPFSNSSTQLSYHKLEFMSRQIIKRSLNVDSLANLVTFRFFMILQGVHVLIDLLDLLPSVHFS